MPPRRTLDGDTADRADRAARVERVDGRRLRRAQNREAVLDALMAMFAEGVYEPGVNEIAERAGISPRSLFRYFDDVDDLNRATILRQQERARPLLDPGVEPGDDLDVRIERLVEARVRLFEALGPAARAARVCAHRNPIVAAEMHEGRVYLRNQLHRLFGPELTGDRSVLLPAIDALCSFETHELLRYDRGLSRTETVATLAGALRALLAAEGDPR